MATKEIRLIAPFHNSSGYAKAGRNLLSSLRLAGYTVEAIESEVTTVYDAVQSGKKSVVKKTEYPLFEHKKGLMPDFQRSELLAAIGTKVPKDAPTIILSTPDSMVRFSDYSDGIRIAYTMLESDTVCPLWKSALRNVDAIFTPSTFCTEVFQRALPDKMVRTVPLAIDERVWLSEGELFNWSKETKGTKPGFVFFSVFSVCERKNWRTMFQAFAEEFCGEDVALVCRCARSLGTVDDVIEIAKWCDVMGADIRILPNTLSEEQMASAYRAADIYLLPSAEGFGMPYLESMACGTPCIALNRSGSADVVNDKCGYSVPAEMRPMPGQIPQIYRSDHSFATCDVDVLKDFMRRAYLDQKDEEEREEMRQECLYQASKFGRHAISKRLESTITSTLNHIDTEESVSVLPAEKVPPLLVGITTHNGLEDTKQCVTALRQTLAGVQYNIVVIDDESSDGTVQWLMEQDIDVIETSGGNLGDNRKKLIEYMNVPPFYRYWCVLMDNDIVGLPDLWYHTLYAFAQSKPELGIVVPSKIYPNGNLQNNGNHLNFKADSQEIMLRRQVIYPAYAEGAFQLMRPEVWRQIQFDDGYKMFFEDVDVSFQAKQLGFDIAVYTDVKVTHNAHGSTSKRSSEYEVSRKRFLSKWRDLL